MTIDLGLDVVSADGNVQILDRDEFEENSARWNYPAHVISNAEATTRYFEPVRLLMPVGHLEGISDERSPTYVVFLAQLFVLRHD